MSTIIYPLFDDHRLPNGFEIKNAPTVTKKDKVPKGYKRVKACSKKYQCPYCGGRTYKLIPIKKK